MNWHITLVILTWGMGFVTCITLSVAAGCESLKLLCWTAVPFVATALMAGLAFR